VAEAVEGEDAGIVAGGKSPRVEAEPVAEVGSAARKAGEPVAGEAEAIVAAQRETAPQRLGEIGEENGVDNAYVGGRCVRPFGEAAEIKRVGVAAAAEDAVAAGKGEAAIAGSVTVPVKLTYCDPTA